MKRRHRDERRTLPDIPTLPEKSRVRKGAIVDRVTDVTTGRDGVVRLDKSRMIFFAELGNEREETYTSAESTDGGAVKRWLAAHLARTAITDRLQWIPVIEINDSSNEDSSYGRRHEKGLRARCSVEIERYYLALTLDQRQWKKLAWEQCDADSPGRLSDDEMYGSSADFRPGPKAEDTRHRAAFSLPWFKGDSYYGREIIVAYTPELWDGFRAVVAAIEGSRATLADMISSKKGIATIAAVGAGHGRMLLGAGENP